MSHPYFYGKEIDREAEQAFINEVLEKYKQEPANDALKEKIYNELMDAKHEGRIHIPFKVNLKEDPSQTFAPYVEVLLDSKV